MTSRRKGFDFRAACRRIDPALHRKLYPTPTREIDIRNRLDRVNDKIQQIAWGRNALGAADLMSELVDERNRLSAALAKAGSKHPPARHVPTGKRGEDGGRP